MAVPPMILERKIAPPPLPSHRVERGRLLEELKKGLPLSPAYPQRMLITAPAGYGKTTFAGQWTSEGKPPAVWLNIEESDNDLHRFFSYLIYALQKKHPTMGKGSLDMLSRYHALTEGSLGIEGILTPLLNELYQIEEPLVLVLDHYHHIDEATIHEAMVFFLENLPENIIPLILSRKEPPWPLHRWRSQGSLVEITEDQLAFTLEETEAYLKGATDLVLNRKDIQALQERTEGWVTALQLVLGTHGDPRSLRTLIHSIAGDHQQILAYLTKEALNHQPKELREFLLDTGGLSRFSPELCNTLLEREDSEMVIHSLLRENLFLVPLDSRGKWYRYRSLFQEILAHHQSREGRTKSGDFYKRAGKWFEAEGDSVEAIKAYLQGEDFEAVAEILDHNIDALWEAEGFHQVQKWMNALPRDLRNQSLRLTVYGGYMTLLMGNLEETMKALAVAETIKEAEDPEAQGILETLRTTLHLIKGDMEEGFESARKALEIIPDEAYFWKITASIVYGDVKTFSGDLLGAREVFEKAYRLSRRSGNALSTVSVAMNILKVLWMRGDLYEVRRFAEETIAMAKEEGYSALPRMGVAWVFLGDILREEGNLKEAHYASTRGLSLCAPEGILYAMAGVFQGAISLSKKEYQEGLEHMARLEAMKHEVELPGMIFQLIRSWKSRLLMEKKEVIMAREAMEGVEVRDLTTILFSGSPPVVHARLLLLEGDREKAREWIHWLKELPQYHLSRRLMIEILLLEARLQEDQKALKAAEDCVIKALKIARGRGFYQIFIDEGSFVSSVFRRLMTSRDENPELQQDPPLKAYLMEVGKAFEINGAKNSPKKEIPACETLIEDLTLREREILKAISKGLSNVDISNTMHLSIHTVKWHNKNIFGKLGVNNRTQAVVRGRELKLIET